MASIGDIFAGYKKWYQLHLFEGTPAKQHEQVKKDFIEFGWYEPFALKPLDAKSRRAAGAIPPTYRALLTELGVGTILCMSKNEPSKHTLVHPKHFARERKAALSWISDEGIERTKKNQKLEVSRLLPFMKTDDTTWVFIGAQKRDDDRVFLFDHGFEGGYDKLFCPVGRSLTDFFTKYFKRSKLGESLNPFNCWNAV